MKEIVDNFSTNSDNYAAFRPTPPDALYDCLYSMVKQFDAAWDCGTGNGQIAMQLAKKFDNVYATDISQKQLEQAPRANNITYKAERAEQSSLPDNRVDLITVAQAVHWFDFEAFNKEIRRVAKPNAIVAMFSYYTPRVSNEVDKVIDDLYWNITRKYWDKERQFVDDKYATIPFPYNEKKTPEINIVLNWNVEQMLGYLRTWSGVKHYIEVKKEDPVEVIAPKLREAWQTKEHKTVEFPLFIRAGEVVK